MCRRNERFVCEPMTPDPGSADARAMARGEPGLPERFTWRGDAYSPAAVLEQWSTTGSCRHGSGERYVRRHWFRIRTDPLAVMTVYCDRQFRSRARWWVYSIEAPDADSTQP